MLFTKYDRQLLKQADKYLSGQSFEVATDWKGTPIMSDEVEQFIDFDGELVLDDKNEIYEYIKEVHRTKTVDNLLDEYVV